MHSIITLSLLALLATTVLSDGSYVTTTSYAQPTATYSDSNKGSDYDKSKEHKDYGKEHKEEHKDYGKEHKDYDKVYDKVKKEYEKVKDQYGSGSSNYDGGSSGSYDSGSSGSYDGGSSGSYDSGSSGSYNSGQYTPSQYSGDNGQYHASQYNTGSYTPPQTTYDSYSSGSSYQPSYSRLLRRGSYGGTETGGDEAESSGYSGTSNTYGSSSGSYNNGQYTPWLYPGDNGQYHASQYNAGSSYTPPQTSYDSGSSSSYQPSYSRLVRRDDGSGSYDSGESTSDYSGSSGSSYDDSSSGSGYSDSGSSYSGSSSGSYSPSGGCRDGRFRCSSGSTTFYKCDHGQWVTFSCAPGTVCYPNTPSRGVILCNYPTY